MFGRRDLRQRDHEVLRQPAVAFEKPGQEQIESPEAAALLFLAEGLDANADAGRDRATGDGVRQFAGGRHRESIFLVIGPMTEAVLEVNPEVFDGLVRQLGKHAKPHALADAGIDAHCVAKRLRSRRIFLQRAKGERSKFSGEIDLEQVGAAVHGMYRLPLDERAGVGVEHSPVSVVHRVEEGVHRALGDRRANHGAEV